MSPTVSVIIPVYNREETILRAVDSVFSQTWKDLELIIVDDGSTDQTATILSERYPQEIQLLSQENQGVSAARNFGVRESSGKWIAFLDSDDYWHPQKLERQMEYLKENSKLNIAQTEEIWIRNGKRVNPHKKHKKPSGWIYEASLTLCTVSPSSVIMTRTLFDRMGGFDEDLMACEDYDLWLRIANQEPVGLLEELLLTKTGGHQDQLSQKYPAMDRFRIYSMIKMLTTAELPTSNRDATENMLWKKLEIMEIGAKKRGKEMSGTMKLVKETLESGKFEYHQPALLQELLNSRF